MLRNFLVDIRVVACCAPSFYGPINSFTPPFKNWSSYSIVTSLGAGFGQWRAIKDTNIVYLADISLGYSFCTIYRDKNLSVVHVKRLKNLNRRAIRNTGTRSLRRVYNVVRAFYVTALNSRNPRTVLDFVEAFKGEVYSRYEIYETDKTLFVYRKIEGLDKHLPFILKIFEEFLLELTAHQKVFEPGPG